MGAPLAVSPESLLLLKLAKAVKEIKARQPEKGDPGRDPTAEEIFTAVSLWMEFHREEVREGNATDGYRTKETRLQYQTKDVIASVLGLIPLASAWSDWADVRTDVVLQDENGNPSP